MKFPTAALVAMSILASIYSARAADSAPTPAPSFNPAPAAASMDHSAHQGHDMSAMGMDGMDMGDMDMGGGMSGALGSYSVGREASGTSWQPDTSSHGGVHVMSGDWMLMGHALLNGVYDRQEGPRGGEKAFVAGMVMGMAQRSFSGGDTLQFRAMLSPDPFMGKPGLPLLLGTGETADGATPLIDRQHPHDLFMESSASYSHKLAGKQSVFFYAGLSGEPAFGPPAFMHRQSINDSPEPPISHHWLDSTHISFGVVTAGYIYDTWKIETSRFHGREPDQNRYDIETGALDSSSVRLSWNPAAEWSLQASWAHVKSPEQLEPADNQTKWSASAIYTRAMGDLGWWSTTAAWGRRNSGQGNLDAYFLESAFNLQDAWTLFGRAERTENDELVFLGGHHGPAYTVSKASLGLIHDWRISTHTKVGVGGLYAFNFLPNALRASYGGNKNGEMVFARLKID